MHAHCPGQTLVVGRAEPLGPRSQCQAQSSSTPNSRFPIAIVCAPRASPEAPPVTIASALVRACATSLQTRERSVKENDEEDILSNTKHTCNASRDAAVFRADSSTLFNCASWAARSRSNRAFSSASSRSTFWRDCLSSPSSAVASESFASSSFARSSSNLNCASWAARSRSNCAL